MNKNRIVRLSGWALILGSVAFAPWLIAIFLESVGFNLLEGSGALDDLLIVSGFLLGPILLSFGMLGLRARYGDDIGRPGRALLLLGALGGAIALLGGLGQELGDPDAFFAAFVGGLALMFLCLAFFGVLALRWKPLPRWNGLPLVAGIWFPIAILLATLDPSSIGQGKRFPDLLFAAGFTLMAIALILLGYVLQADTPREPTPAL